VTVVRKELQRAALGTQMEPKKIRIRIIQNPNISKHILTISIFDIALSCFVQIFPINCRLNGRRYHNLLEGTPHTP
jgi:hypothetical protein